MMIMMVMMMMMMMTDDGGDGDGEEVDDTWQTSLISITVLLPLMRHARISPMLFTTTCALFMY